MFHVGQQVVCIDDSQWRRDVVARWGIALPSKGSVYTVCEILIGPSSGEPCIRLEEIVNPLCDFAEGRGEAMFKARYFRPVRKTDISIFTAMLNPVKEDA